MNKTSLFRQAIGGLFFLFLCSIFLAGCAAQKRSCPPLKTIEEATAILKEYSANLKPLKATGNCMLSYTNEKGEKFAQSFPVRIWFQSSRKFCLYGDVMFDPRGVCFAVIDDEYWTYAKPFGVYIKGKIKLSLEDSSDRASFYARQELSLDKIESPEAYYKKIDQVTAGDIKKIANEILVENKINFALRRNIFTGICAEAGNYSDINRRSSTIRY